MLCQIDEIETATSELYTGMGEMSTHVATGMSVIQNGWTGSEYRGIMDSSWRTAINTACERGRYPSELGIKVVMMILLRAWKI